MMFIIYIAPNQWCVYIYIYICMYIYIRIFYLYTYAYLCIYICNYIDSMYSIVYIYIYICVYVSIYIYIWLYMYSSKSIYVLYIYIYMSIYIHIDIYIYIIGVYLFAVPWNPPLSLNRPKRRCCCRTARPSVQPPVSSVWLLGFGYGLKPYPGFHTKIGGK